VDSDSPFGAPRLYEACGFRVVKRNAAYRKPLLLADAAAARFTAPAAGTPPPA
jgi:hypothetical protein